MFISIFRFFLFFFSVCFVLEAKTKEDIKKYIPVFEKEIQKIKETYRAPGLAIAIIKDNEIVYQQTFGEKENGKKNPIDGDTVFQIASTTKTFLTFVLAQLVEEGVLSWDTPISKYLPELVFHNETAHKDATILDLVTHRMGLPPFSGDSLWHMGYEPIELLKTLRKIPFKFGFREHYTYQNHLFGAASVIIERVTNKKIDQVFQERIFKPLGMKNASATLKAIQPSLFGFIKPNFAYPHDIRDGKVFTKPLTNHMYLFTGSSGANLSLNDAVIWLQFLMNNYTYKGKQFLKPETVAFLQSPHVACTFSDHETQFHKERFSNTHYCVGFFKSQYGCDKDNILIAHMGGFNGVRSYIGFIPSQNLGLVMLSNYGSMNISLMPEAIRNTFLDWYFDLPTLNWIELIYQKSRSYIAKYQQTRMQNRMYNPTAARNLKEYVGTYTHNLYGNVIIKIENSTLTMSYRGKTIPLTHWNGDEFSIKPFDLSPSLNDYDFCPIYFITDKEGNRKMYIGQLYEGSPTFDYVSNVGKNK